MGEIETAAPVAARSERRGTIGFSCPMCAVDPTSGAAIAICTILSALSTAGYRTFSYSASIMDPNGEVPFGPVLGKDAADPANRGRTLRFERDGTDHLVFLTTSSQGKKLTAEEAQAFLQRWRKAVRDERPDIILTFGTSALSRAMHQVSRDSGAQIVHFLANGEFTDTETILPEDGAITCSDFLRRRYSDRLGVNAKVLYPILPLGRSIGPGEPSIAASADRRLGFVTFVNPLPNKGLTLFHWLAKRALRERPDIRFLVIESRMPREVLQRMKVDLGAMPNVWLIPTQRDVREIYRRTAVMLYPSFWAEGFGQGVVESQRSGIPVIASTRGGLPEALNGGGIALDISKKCHDNYYAYPEPDCREAWWDALIGIWDDDARYAEASSQARKAAERYHPETTAAEAVAYVDSLMAARAG